MSDDDVTDILLLLMCERLRCDLCCASAPNLSMSTISARGLSLHRPAIWQQDHNYVKGDKPGNDDWQEARWPEPHHELGNLHPLRAAGKPFHPLERGAQRDEPARHCLNHACTLEEGSDIRKQNHTIEWQE
eukprot:3518716-Amphidinium_carterae.1